MRSHWGLRDELIFLNHGSFGACPTEVLELQTRLRAQMELDPVHFFVRQLPTLWGDARQQVAEFVGAKPDDLVFVRNATAAANAVFRSLRLEPSDELVVTTHGYNAVTNVARYVAERSSARVVEAPLGFPLQDPDEVVETVLSATNDRTRLVVVDHVTSPTGLVLPIKKIVDRLSERGIDCFVDGAHGPGMLELDLRELGAAYYTGNFHKWVCAPKGAAMLHVRKDRQDGLHPAVISHGYNMSWLPNPYLREFDWTGTDDPTPVLCVPQAIEVLAKIGGGWTAIRERCRAMVLRGRELLASVLGARALAPDSMVGLLAAVELPDGGDEPPTSALYADPLGVALYDKHRIQVPIIPWPAPPKRLIRISAFLHNQPTDYEALASALSEELG